MSKKISDELMAMGEEKFWEEFNDQQEEKKYVIVDENGEVIVTGAKLTKRKKKIRV